MNDTDFVDKTERGAQEIKTRSLKLPQRLRTMLIMIDGNVSVAQLRDAAAKLAVQDDFLDVLLRDGLVVLLPGIGIAHKPPAAAATTAASSGAAPQMAADASTVERFMAARKLMNDSVVDGLGIRAFFFTLKLERAFNREDLLALMDDYLKAIRKGSGAAAAEVLEGRVRSLLQ